MSQRKSISSNDRFKRRALNRRQVVHAGMAGAAGIAASGVMCLAGASPRMFRRQDASPEPVQGGRLRIASTGQPAGSICTSRTTGRSPSSRGTCTRRCLPSTGTMRRCRCSPRASRPARTDSPNHHTPPGCALSQRRGDEGSGCGRVVRALDAGELARPRYPAVPREHHATDDYTVDIALTSPLVALPSMLARQSQGLSIHPKSVLDAAGSPLPHESYIGTGPYRSSSSRPTATR